MQAVSKTVDAESAAEVKSPGDLVAALGYDANAVMLPCGVAEGGVDKLAPDTLALVENGQQVDCDLGVLLSETAKVPALARNQHPTRNGISDPLPIEGVMMRTIERRNERIAVAGEIGRVSGDRRVVEREP